MVGTRARFHGDQAQRWQLGTPGHEFVSRQCSVGATVADVDDIVKIVRVVGYVNGVAGFINQPAVVNGVSELFLHIWGEAGKHARSAVGIAELPMDSPVEVELTVELRS